MTRKLLLTLRAPADRNSVTGAGAQVLAEYPDSLLVRATDAQQAALQQAGVESSVLDESPVQVTGASFNFADAVAADVATPVTPPSPDRVAYYLVSLVGPAKGEWLDRIRSLGGTIHGSVPGLSLIVGILPKNVPTLQQEQWVEGVTPFRPAMKVSPQLRAGNYEIRVRGVSVTRQAPGAAVGANPRQDFALVVSNGTSLTL